MLEHAVIGGRYRLESPLGAGGMGTVYQATDEVTRTSVAVKIIRAEHLTPFSQASKRFEREARAIGALDIPHIVRLLDAGHDDAENTPYLVMERLHGRDLKQLLSDLGPLPPMLVVRLVAHAASGLSAAHATGIVHRDVKPANLFLCEGEDATLKVLDFGVSKFEKGALPSDNTSMSLSIEGSMIGSPAYMSPEQARGESDLDARTDVWSLGVVMYEALTGHLPFGERLPLGQVILAICSMPAQPVLTWAPWVPSRIAAIVHRAIAKSREERFQSVDELLEALRAIDPQCQDAIASESVVSLREGALPAPRSSHALLESMASHTMTGSDVVDALPPPAADSSASPIETDASIVDPLRARRVASARVATLLAVAAAAILIAIAFVRPSGSPITLQAHPGAARTLAKEVSTPQAGGRASAVFRPQTTEVPVPPPGTSTTSPAASPPPSLATPMRVDGRSVPSPAPAPARSGSRTEDLYAP